MARIGKHLDSAERGNSNDKRFRCLCYPKKKQQQQQQLLDQKAVLTSLRMQKLEILFNKLEICKIVSPSDQLSIYGYLCIHKRFKVNGSSSDITAGYQHIKLNQHRFKRFCRKIISKADEKQKLYLEKSSSF
ncbi:CLUMA_CG008341, isoform A [Clunio marinus]|uniref:CLUMA_CG008341, isoform A n=1 Tax=Clunio marinus TaxID=568069 RepID=A0A1J1I8V1_9DIPT|nr:CLUMA_CG008341, isoform A [Clunio marinus]